MPGSSRVCESQAPLEWNLCVTCRDATLNLNWGHSGTRLPGHPVLWTESHPSKIPVAALTPSVIGGGASEVIKVKCGHRVGPSSTGLTRRGSDSRDACAQRKGQGESSPQKPHVWHLNLGLPAPRTVRNRCLLGKPPVCGPNKLPVAHPAYPDRRLFFSCDDPGGGAGRGYTVKTPPLTVSKNPDFSARTQCCPP